MDKGDDSPPPAPDPGATAAAQGAANKETAIAQARLNAMNQKTPYGSLTYTEGGKTDYGVPIYSVEQTLSPEQQAISDEQQKASLTYGQTANTLLGNTKNMLGSAFTLDSLGAAPAYNDAYRDAQRQKLIQRSQGDWDARRAALETQLANQGINAGTQAYDDAFRTYNQGWNDFLTASDLSAGNLAGTEYSREMAARQNAINEMLMPRSTALNELAALARGNQVSMPSYVNTPQTSIAPTDYLGAQALSSNIQSQNANRVASQQNALMGGLFGLGGAALGGSLAGGFWGK
jgi:hypothetical protein